MVEGGRKGYEKWKNRKRRRRRRGRRIHASSKACQMIAVSNNIVCRSSGTSLGLLLPFVFSQRKQKSKDLNLQAGSGLIEFPEI